MRTWIPLILLLLALPPTAQAQTCSTVSWEENRSAAFAFLHPVGDLTGASVAADHASALDQDYQRLSKLFESSLPLPITVRVYPTERHYYCLNTLAPDLAIGSTHGHLGTREIALISANIGADPGRWQQQGLNDLRFELAALFIEHITNGQAPPGLQTGMSLYAEDPALSFEYRLVQHPPPLDQPDVTWRSLWDSPNLLSDPHRGLQSASIVAYLIDVYGWTSFVEFLKALPTTGSYRQPLLDVYGAELGVLQEHWRQYYPVYFQGRWRANVLYGFDLTVFEQLIAAGAYADAGAGLQEAISFLVQIGDVDKVIEAERLSLLALAGQEADALTRQSRQALLEKDYAAALSFAIQARSKYDDLGDTRRLEELDAYAAVSQEVLDLRSELVDLQGQISPISGVEHAPRLLEIGNRLGQLGDDEGLAVANGMLDALSAQRQQRAVLIILIGGVVVIGLLLIRLALSGTRIPVEVELQT
jgi:hypothetical protein